jgi:phosphoserine phosphatase
VAVKSKRDIKVQLISRYLSEREAAALRADVAAMKPRVHLVAANWRWLEVRGLGEEKAARLIERWQALGLQFTVISGGFTVRTSPETLNTRHASANGG